MRPAAPETVAARFREIVARGIAKADREAREELAKIRALPRLASGSRERMAEFMPPVRRRRP